MLEVMLYPKAVQTLTGMDEKVVRVACGPRHTIFVTGSKKVSHSLPPTLSLPPLPLLPLPPLPPPPLPLPLPPLPLIYK
jgi:hypothetical protein